MIPKQLLAGLAALGLASAPLAALALEAPADGWVTWTSTRKERSEAWIARADGSGATRLTTSGATRVFWAPDGRWIAYGDESGRVFVMRPDGTEPRRLSAAGQPAFWMKDNSGFVLKEDAGDYVRVDPETLEQERLFAQSDFRDFARTTFMPNDLTHDGRYLLVASHLYIDGYTGANGSFKSEFSAVAVDLLRKEKVYFIGTGCWPFAPPDGRQVFHICGLAGGCPNYPDVYRMSLDDLATRRSYEAELANPDADWGHEYNPRISNDGKWIAYMTSTGCHDGAGCNYDIFLHPVGGATNARVRVTDHAAFDGYPDLYVGPVWTKQAPARLLVTPDRIAVHALSDVVATVPTIAVKSTGTADVGAVEAVVEPAVPWLGIEAKGARIGVKVLRERGLSAGKNVASIVVKSGGLAAERTIPVVVFADDSFPPPAAARPTPGPGDAGAAEGGVDAAQAQGGVDAGAPDAGGSPGPAAPGPSGGRGGGCSHGGSAGFGLMPILAALGLLRRARRRSSR